LGLRRLNRCDSERNSLKYTVLGKEININPDEKTNESGNMLQEDYITEVSKSQVLFSIVEETKVNGAGSNIRKRYMYREQRFL